MQHLHHHTSGAAYTLSHKLANAGNDVIPCYRIEQMFYTMNEIKDEQTAAVASARLSVGVRIGKREDWGAAGISSRMTS